MIYYLWEMIFMAITINLEDEEFVVKGPHYYLTKRRSIEELENEIRKLLKEKGPMPLSAIWRRLDCHLWEVAAALRRLKKKGLVEERNIVSEVYGK